MADRAARSEDSVPGHPPMLRVAFGRQRRQGPAHLAGQARTAHHSADVAVRSHVPRRHIADHREYARVEVQAAVFGVKAQGGLLCGCLANAQRKCGSLFGTLSSGGVIARENGR